MTVTFCGHRKIKYIKTTSNLLYMHIENLIINGACLFSIGGYGDFDELVAKTVKKSNKNTLILNPQILFPMQIKKQI